MSILFLVLFSASTPLTSADLYSFSVPNVPSNICGKIMGTGPDYRILRSEDIAFIFEAVNERDVIAAYGTPETYGIDSVVPKRLTVNAPKPGSWYRPDVKFMGDIRDISKGDGKAAWDDGGIRHAIVTANYGGVTNSKMVLNGYYSVDKIRDMYKALKKYTVCGFSPYRVEVTDGDRVMKSKDHIVYHRRDNREGPYYPDETLDENEWTEGPSMVYNVRTKCTKEHYRQKYYDWDAGSWKECQGSPYVDLTKYTWKYAPEKYVAKVSIDLSGEYDTTNWTHRVGEEADVYVQWRVSGFDGGWRYNWSDDKSVDYTNETQVLNCMCVTKYVAKYSGEDTDGLVAFELNIENFENEVIKVARLFGLTVAWDVDAQTPNTPPSPTHFNPEWQDYSHSVNNVYRLKYVDVSGDIAYVVIRPNLPTAVE